MAQITRLYGSLELEWEATSACTGMTPTLAKSFMAAAALMN
jgi:hypothetical protein